MSQFPVMQPWNRKLVLVLLLGGHLLPLSMFVCHRRIQPQVGLGFIGTQPVQLDESERVPLEISQVIKKICPLGPTHSYVSLKSTKIFSPTGKKEHPRRGLVPLRLLPICLLMVLFCLLSFISPSKYYNANQKFSTERNPVLWQLIVQTKMYLLTKELRFSLCCNQLAVIS